MRTVLLRNVNMFPVCPFDKFDALKRGKTAQVQIMHAWCRCQKSSVLVLVLLGLARSSTSTKLLVLVLVVLALRATAGCW